METSALEYSSLTANDYKFASHANMLKVRLIIN